MVKIQTQDIPFNDENFGAIVKNNTLILPALFARLISQRHIQSAHHFLSEPPAVLIHLLGKSFTPTKISDALEKIRVELEKIDPVSFKKFDDSDECPIGTETLGKDTGKTAQELADTQNEK